MIKKKWELIKGEKKKRPSRGCEREQEGGKEKERDPF